MEHSYAAGLIVAGIINTIPVSGVLSGAQLQKLYGLPFAAADPNTKLLLQHRAVLFGIVGGLSFAAVARPELRPAALVSGLTSMLSFIGLAKLIPGKKNASMQRVVTADIIASAALVIGWTLDRYNR